MGQTLSIETSGSMMRTVRQRMGLIVYLTRMEFERRYSSTVGGAAWLFAGPLLTIFTIWIALEYGLSTSGRFGERFGASFAIGLAAWLYFADVVQTATGSITSNPHLVKKVVFPVWVLPLASALSAFLVHLVVLVVVGVALWIMGVPLRPHLLLLPFWMAGLVVCAATIGLLLASLNVRFRDTSVIAPNLVSLMFWLTPIVWPLAQVSGGWRSLALLSPMAVIIEGYRSALGLSASEVPLVSSIAFLLILSGFAGLAFFTYRRYRPQFADTL